MNNINVQNFDSDVQKGESFQAEVLSQVRKKSPKAHEVKGNFKDFDILVSETGQRIEAKYDERSDNTGNYFFEYEFNGQPSGLAATKADWYVVGNYMWRVWLPVPELKEFLRPMLKGYSRTVTGKDETQVKGVVAPMMLVWKQPFCKKHRFPSYEQMWKEMGCPSDFTKEDMAYIDSIL